MDSKVWLSSYLLIALALTAPVVIADETKPTNKPSVRVFPEMVNQFFATYCGSCHGPEKPKADLHLERLSQDLIEGPHAEDWHEVLDALNKGEMPPEEEKQPSKAERDAVVSYFTGAFKEAVEARRSTGGEVVMRRLTNYEYNHTLNDLLALNENWSEEFSPDSLSADGFKNNGFYMGISGLQIDNYIKAATLALDEAIYTSAQPKLKTIDFKDVESLTSRSGKKVVVQKGSGRTLYWKDHPKEGPVVVDIAISGISDEELERISTRLSLHAGSRLSVKVVNNIAYESKQVTVEPLVSNKGDLVHLQYRIPKIELYPRVRDNHPFEEYTFHLAGLSKDMRVVSMKAKGPYYETWPPRSHRQIFIPSRNEKNEAVYAREILSSFMTRAWRRRVTKQEVDELYRVYQSTRKKASFVDAIKDCLTQVLVSADFLYLVERKHPSGKREKLSPHELASRLSYFLWSSKPDEKLFGLANQGKLSSPETLRAEVQRLLKDDRSWRFVDQFSSQWLGLDRVDTVAVNPEIYPDFDDALIGDMKKETQHFFGYMLRENLSAVNFIDSEFTFLTERLQRHYGGGRTRPGSPAVRKVNLKNAATDRRGKSKGISHRGGILAHASIHLAYSDGEDSHAVNRGVWLVDKILGNPPPAPPADVEFDQTIEGFSKMSLKQQLAVHVENESCANCHKKIDPFGVAFENYDAVGAFRTKVRKVDDEELVRRLAMAKAKEDPEVSFKRIDTNGDGFLQKNEWFAHRKKNYKGRTDKPGHMEKYLEGEWYGVAQIRADTRGMNNSHPKFTVSPEEYKNHIVKREVAATRKVQENLPYRYVDADATTVLPDSTRIKGLNDLKAYVLKHKKDEFAENIVRRLLAYGLGRSLEFSDDQTVQALTKQFKANDYKLASLVEEIVLCDLFQTK